MTSTPAKLVLGCFMAIAIQSFAHEASAQYGGTASQSVNTATRRFLYNRPTVSPYLNLSTSENREGLSNYFTQVRPLVEQQQAEMQRQRMAAQMQAELTRVQDKVRQSQQSVDNIMTGRVGWSARGLPRFNTLMNYYPGFSK